MAHINIEETQEQARKLLNSRVESVTALANARQRVTELQEQLAEAQREDKRAYVRATKDGWSADELKKMGLENNAASKRRASRRATNTTREAETALADSTARDGDS